MANDRRRPHPVGPQVRVVARLFSFWGFAALTMAITRLDGGGVADNLFLDAQTLTDLPWYAGAISDLNLVVWAISAAVAAVGGWVAFQTNRPSAGRFLVASCFVSLWLLLDDMFLLHTDALPDSLGVPLAVAAFTVIVPVLAWVAAFRDEVRRTRWLILACAMFAFLIALITGLYWSVAVGATVVDDGATALGACAWGIYIALTTRDIMRSTIRTALESHPETVATETEAAPELVSAN